MKVLKTNWKQENDNVVKDALVIPKVTYFSREDVETIRNTNESEGEIVWKARAQCSCLFEVYPDEQSFTKRVFPMSIFKKVLYLPYDEISNKNLTTYFLESLISEGHDVAQDFTNGKIIDIEVLNYIAGEL